MNTKNLENLGQFTGSEEFYRYGILPHGKLVITEGAKYLADNAEAYWLLDEIAVSQLIPEVHQEEFQTWKLTVSEKNKGTLVCEDGNYRLVYAKEIEYTDFPLPVIELWFENNTIYLPSER